MSMKYNNINLNEKQIKVLKKYNIGYQKFNNLNELIYHLEYYLNNQDLPDLEEISIELDELEYYNYTNK